MPQKQISRDIIKLAGFPLAAPSANKFQHLSPTSAEHVLAQLGGKIDGIVDGGACEIGVESTIVGFEDELPVIYRPGAITKEMIGESFGKTLAPSPGMFKKHYSPNTKLCLGLPDDVPPNCGLLAFGENSLEFAKTLNLSAKGDLTEAAANLYSMLHELDSCGLDRIYAMLLPPIGIGVAINDRLVKAAGQP